MNRKDVIRLRKKLFRVQTWKILFLLVPLMAVAATFYRVDHLGMVERVNLLIEADEENDAELIKTRLEDLRAFVFSHPTINVVERNGRQEVIFGTGQFYLENQYVLRANEELALAEESMGAGESNPNGNVFKIASDICTARGSSEGWRGNSARFIECVMAELEKFPASDEINDFKTAMIPPTALYRHNYASPVWTFGFSGITVLICLLLVAFILVRYLLLIVLGVIEWRVRRRKKREKAGENYLEKGGGV